jgi:hypothetical protein
MSAADMMGGGRRVGGVAWVAGRHAAAAMVALAAVLLAAAVVLLGGGGGAGGHHHGAAARVVAVAGGLLRVDAVTEDAPMRMAGMPMPSGPNVKDVPRGFRRFTVAVTLLARGGRGMHVTPDRFRLTAAGQAPRVPIDDDRDDVYVPGGTSYPRELTFDVPRAVTAARLSVRGGAQSIGLRLGAAPAAGADHAHR